MSLPRFSIHGHFYQPTREDPFTGQTPPEGAASPYRDWNDRIAAECYGPNAAAGNFARIGFDIGPTLARWLRRERPETHDAIAAQGHGRGAMAQPFHHAILPLASTRDRRTEIIWGLRDAELRFGHRPLGLWLPETAVDLLTLRIAAEEGVRYTILAPWQAATTDLDTRRPYRVELGADRHIVVAFYQGALSAAVSFEPSATADVGRFVEQRALPSVGEALPDGHASLTLIATDGELYGHHMPFRDLFLESLTTTPSDQLGLELTTIGDLLADPHPAPMPVMAIRDQTSWSCHHGILRWSGECPDAADGRWKRPLRVALERLAAAVDVVAERDAAAVGVDVWAARDAWADVASGYLDEAEAVERIQASAVRGRPATAAQIATQETAARLAVLLRAETSRLAMFASDAWFWDDPSRQETTQAMLWAAHAARLIDELAGTRLEATLVADLAALRSPGSRLDGAELYAMVLRAIGQPPPKG
ncbi:MAG: DUF3536 domain-containing protein [Candidatus Limnocylindrales bacterium]